MRRHAVIVIYTFPPMGGPGVQRAVKFGKYLPESGWDLTFVTVKDVVYHAYDPTLVRALPPDIEVVRTDSADPLRIAYLLRKLRGRFTNRDRIDPHVKVSADTPAKAQILRLYRTLQSWVFVVDPQVLWIPFAVAAGVRAVRARNSAVVVAMPQPRSTALAGYLISLFTRRPLVLDMRDPWTQDPYYRMPTALHRKVNEWLESRVIRYASELVVISDSMRQAIIDRYPELADRVTVITNGFDSEDFVGAPQVPKDGRFDIVYTGSLYNHHAPVFRVFCAGLRTLLHRRPELATRVRLRLVGRIEREIDELLTEENVRHLTDITGYVSHAEAIGFTKAADLLLLLIKNDLDEKRDVITIPGKFFEYMASRRPILYLGPQCEASKILQRTGQGNAVALDPEEIAREIERNIDERVTDRIDHTVIDTYERRNQAGKMASIMDRAYEIQPSRQAKTTNALG